MKAFAQSWIFCLLILFSVTQNSIAQNESLVFEHIGIEGGLANASVTTILQDRKGFLWVGTFDGLYKYDGYSFTKYQYDPSDPNSLPQNLIYTIFEDKAGTIWTSTIEGLCKFDRSTEKFTRYKPSPDAIFSNPNIFSISEDTDGMMWVGSTTGELCRFDRKTGKFLEERFDLGLVPGDTAASMGIINCIYKDQAGILWVGNSTGLHALKLTGAKAGQPSAVSITHYRHDQLNPNSLSSNIVGSVFEDKAGIIWVATDNGLNSFDRKTGIFERFRHDPENSRSISSNNLAFFPFPDIQEDQEGNLWIGTDKGLNKLNKDRTIFTAYLNNPTGANSISSDVITSLEIDLAGILWAGAFDGKLNKANLNKKAFGLNRHDPDNINSLSNNEVRAIVEDAAGIIWMGTSGGGLNRWDKKTNQFTHYMHNPNNPRTLKHDYISAMLEDRDGQLWVCNAEVLSQLHKQTGEFTHYSDVRNNDDGEETILSLTEDQEGLLWIGLVGKGIKSFDKKSGHFERYYYDPADTSGISDYVALKVFADSKDNIWIGHGSMATDKFNKRTRRFTHYKHDPHDSTSISSNIVTSFYEDPKGNIWMGTSAGGLCYYDYQQEKFTTYTTKHGLPDNSLYSILIDNQNNVWLGTGNGLSRFDPVTKTFTNYDYKDGLQSNVFARGAFKGKDGTLYFGGNNGFNFFDPLKIKANSTIAHIVITQFKLFDKLIKGANESKEIVLDYDQNYFSFEFSSLSFYNPSKNQYAYKLEGFDKDWVYSGSRRYAGYTYVDPGEYTFKVKGTNNDGVWNETGTSIIIRIRPPWWRTWWAYSFYGACFIGAIIMTDRYQRRRVINKERERTRERELEQAHEIEKAYHKLKATQAQLIQSEKMASLGELTAGIAHEIQNPLNFVNNFSEVNKELLFEMKEEIEKGNLEEAKSLAGSVIDNQEKINQHGKRADAIVKGMLQHSRSSSGIKERTHINTLVDEYVRLAYHGLRAKDKTFNATLKSFFEDGIGTVHIIPQDIGRVILNLLNNAFYAVSAKASTEDGKYEPTVSVSTKKFDSAVLISIKDNGSGIPEKVLDKIFQPFFTTKPTGQGTGLGLSLSYDIVKAHGGEIKIVSNEGQGAEFIIQLPAHSS